MVIEIDVRIRLFENINTLFHRVSIRLKHTVETAYEGKGQQYLIYLLIIVVIAD